MGVFQWFSMGLHLFSFGQAWTSALFLLDGTAEVGRGRVVTIKRGTQEAVDGWILQTYSISRFIASITIYNYLHVFVRTHYWTH